MNRKIRLLPLVFAGVLSAIGTTADVCTFAGEPAVGAAVATKATEASVKSGLGWLSAHQSADGNWSRDKFDETCKLNRCGGKGAAGGDVATTGIALLAFLGAGETQKTSTYLKTVGNAQGWLRDQWDHEGCAGPRTASDFLRQHAIAALAMTESYGMTGSQLAKVPAQRAVTFALTKRRTAGGWSRSGAADGDLDVETTAWMVMLMKSATMSELDVDANALPEAAAALDAITDPKTGVTQGGSAATAMALLCRIFAGHVPKDDPLIDKAGDALLARLPKKDAEDQLAWHFGSLAMFQLGGERWKAWNAAMLEAVPGRQYAVPDRDERGSWAPSPTTDAEGGRVWVTALQTLDMEVYYRYGRVLKAK